MTDRRQQAARAKQSIEDAVTLPRQATGRFPAFMLVAAILLWSAMFIAAVICLPERVAIHWSGPWDVDGFSRADNWVRKPTALLFFAVTFMGIMALTLLSRLVMKVPEAINTPHKQWWMASGERLVRYEQLLREDLMLIVSATVTLLACIEVQIILASRTPDCASPWWVFWVLLIGYFGAVGTVLVRIIGSSRYTPEGAQPEGAQPEGAQPEGDASA